MCSPTARPRRPGFTLTELLMVIVVIALLAALLLPAIGSAVRKARETTVSSEINMFAQALADFKSKYGDYPPSRILLCENGNYGTWISSTTALPTPTGTPTTGDINYAQLAQRSLMALRKFWPRAAFSTTGAVWPSGSTTWYDFNGNGVMDNAYILDGRECLTFFLGGIPLYGAAGGTFNLNGQGGGMIGFSRLPQNPFMNGIVGTSNYSNNRIPPLFEFRGNRLILLPEKQALPTKSALWTGIPGYYDANSSQNTPSFYAYFSAYGGAYDPNDVNAIDVNNVGNYETDANGTPITLSFKVAFPVYSSGSQVASAVSPPPNPYTTSFTNSNSTQTIGTVTYQNSQTFQIISPGADNLYGLGGQYTPTAGIVLPLDSSNTTSTDTSIRTRERDNLTNFHNGRLE